MNDEIFIHICKRCSYKWASRRKRPKTCANPKCRSPYWDKERKA